MWVLHLKKLEIYGFKSFAERVEITFEHGITGIVGPNGSGKSNISDAVRWVLGEQSAKTLRGAKMEDIIFNGTEKRRKLSYCEVSLVFDNTDNALPIDFAEVAVTRRVYRNGDSEYQLNRAACRLKDIIDLFRDTGIGKEGYSLIGQGRIDEILSAKSEERRQVFEEAAGINKYKSCKTDAERRIANTEQNLSRVEDIIAELEGRIEPLREQSESAREFLALREELKALDLNAFLVRSVRYEERITDITRTVTEFAQSIEDMEAKQKEYALQREQLEIALSEHELNAAQSRDQVQGLIREVEAREGMAAVLRERISSTQREKERVEQGIANALQVESQLKEQIVGIETQLSADIKIVEEKKRGLSENEALLVGLETELEDKEAQLEQAKARVIDSMNRLSDVRSEQSRLNAMEQQLVVQIKKLELESGSSQRALLELEEQEQKAEQHLKKEQDLREVLNTQVQQVDEQVRASATHTQELARQIEQMSAQRQSAASRLRVLEEMRRDYEGYQHSVKQVLIQAKRMDNSGVHGVVANLIRVPKELERAIDMVLGGALQNVVVEAEEDAKRMIEYLRQNRLGRATFLPLSAVRSRVLNQSERQVLSLPGCVGVASELVEYDPRYRGVVENLLGRTVIAQDLQAGIAIQRASRHSLRLVTLQGDVMHSGGSMTGGSLQSRVTSLLSREREIDEHVQLLKQLEKDLTEKRNQMEALESERSRAKQERNRLYDQLHQQEIACTRGEAHLLTARQSLLSKQEQAEQLQSEFRRMQDQLEDVRNELVGLTDTQDGVEQNSAEHQSEILQMQQNLSSLRERVNAMREQVTNEKISLAAYEREVISHQKEKDSLEQQAAKAHLQKQSDGLVLNENSEQAQRDMEQLKLDEAEIERLKQQLDQDRSLFGQVEQQRTRVQQQIREVTKQLDNLREDIQSITERHHRSELQLSRIQSEFKQLQERIWEDYELTYAGAKEYKVEPFNLTEAEKRIAAIRLRIKQIGSVNMSAVDEYREVSARYEDLTSQRNDLQCAQLDLQSIIEELHKQMEDQFSEQFALLNQNFQETFVALFGGGRAELRLEDPKDALNCGIDIVAQPPGKKLQMLSLLSGGERALTAIAILFAMLKLKPTPFCFLDEIEAALDDANIDNFADYLVEYSKNTQFVVVTHRKGTMERCDALYGIAMEEKGVSKLVSIKLGEQNGLASAD